MCFFVLYLFLFLFFSFSFERNRKINQIDFHATIYWLVWNLYDVISKLRWGTSASIFPLWYFTKYQYVPYTTVVNMYEDDMKDIWKVLDEKENGQEQKWNHR